MNRTNRIENSLASGRMSLRDFAAVIRLWRQRSRSRRRLWRLDDHQLRDIGIDRHAAEEEARKPFWRA